MTRNLVLTPSAELDYVRSAIADPPREEMPVILQWMLRRYEHNTTIRMPHGDPTRITIMNAQRVGKFNAAYQYVVSPVPPLPQSLLEGELPAEEL